MRSHPRSHDGRAHGYRRHSTGLVAGAAALVAALLSTGCDAAPGKASAEDVEFSTVRFTLGSRGDIQLAGASRATVGPAGAYPVSGGRAHRFARPEGKLLVVLRHRPQTRTDRASRGRVRRLPPLEEPSVETGFLVDTANRVRADLDGHPLQWLRRDTIRIDTTNTAAGDLTRLTLSAPHGGRHGQPHTAA